jgi:hypothetical protein
MHKGKQCVLNAAPASKGKKKKKAAKKKRY